MCDVQGSTHYKMILVNYLEPTIYRMAGVDSQVGMSAFLLAPPREGSVGQPWASLWMVNLGVAPSWGPCKQWHQAEQESPSLRLLAFSAVVVVALGLSTGRRQRKITPGNTVSNKIMYRQAKAICLGRTSQRVVRPGEERGCVWRKSPLAPRGISFAPSPAFPLC